MEPDDSVPAAGTALAPRAPAEPRARPLLLVALLALAVLLGFSWYDARERIGATQEELARRLRAIEGDSREAVALARGAQDAAREIQAKLAALENRVAESQSQQLALEALYQELSRNRDEWQLAEIEQVLAIAAQQLQLSGNVRAALLALQLAETRLARADRPQFLAVRRALSRDIERLRALPALDLPGMSLRLDGLVASVDALPLAFDERAERPGAAGAEAKGGAAAPGRLARFGAELWDELKQLVSVRRIDEPALPMLPPAQAYFLRENLKLRLLSARIALLTRNEAGFREDLRVAQGWIQRYFDPKSKQAIAAIAQIKQLQAVSISLELPSISDSLEAVRSFKSRDERGRK
jgi:uncharacterized protein HemX